MPTKIRPAVRNTPSQDRGVRRVEAILDAANGLLAEVGYEALTLTAVAERSGSAISSLYRFFSNKDELIAALADRVAARLRPIVADVLSPNAAALPVDVFAGRLVERLALVASEFPGMAEIMGRVIQRHAAFDQEIANRLEAIFAVRAPHLPEAQRSVAVRMTMAIVRGGIALVMKTPAARRPPAIEELRAALTAYLTVRLR